LQRHLHPGAAGRVEPGTDVAAPAKLELSPPIRDRLVELEPPLVRALGLEARPAREGCIDQGTVGGEHRQEAADECPGDPGAVSTRALHDPHRHLLGPLQTVSRRTASPPSASVSSTVIGMASSETTSRGARRETWYVATPSGAAGNTIVPSPAASRPTTDMTESASPSTSSTKSRGARVMFRILTV